MMGCVRYFVDRAVWPLSAMNCIDLASGRTDSVIWIVLVDDVHVEHVWRPVLLLPILSSLDRRDGRSCRRAHFSIRGESQRSSPALISALAPSVCMKRTRWAKDRVAVMRPEYCWWRWWILVSITLILVAFEDAGLAMAVCVCGGCWACGEYPRAEI